MPYINISTSAKIEDKKKILDEISILISTLTNKSKRFVMAKLEDNSEMYFEDESPCCFLEIKRFFKPCANVRANIKFRL